MPAFNKTHTDVTTPSAELLEAAQGIEVNGDDPVALAHAIDLAFDYRGDVTIIRRSDSNPIEGYIFDRRKSASPAESKLRMIPSTSDERITIAYSDIARLVFSGRDTAAGKSFDTWMKKYVQKKLAGQEASIHSEFDTDP